MDLYKTIKTGNKRCDVTGRFVNIPASYWGKEGIDSKFWKEEKYEKSLKDVSMQVMESDVVNWESLEEKWPKQL